MYPIENQRACMCNFSAMVLVFIEINRVQDLAIHQLKSTYTTPLGL